MDAILVQSISPRMLQPGVLVAAHGELAVRLSWIEITLLWLLGQ